ncbi:MAG: SBBP repeat-containing protein, partial [Planctomycetota bacterium]|nr:SBBP repeat-containing protein [Planctomycetota bacterium]
MQLFSTSPALFVENQGQWSDSSVRYVHNGDGVNVAMTDAGIAFQVFQQDTAAPASDPLGPTGEQSAPMRGMSFGVSFVGATPVVPVGLEKSDSTFNYYLGEQANWHGDVPSYQTVAYEGLYPGIDLQTWGRRSNLKYEFHVAPGADWRQIALHYDGISGLSINADGSLAVDLGADRGTMVDDAPYIYQVIDGQKVQVPGQFVLLDDSTYSFQITGAYDATQPVVIDPELAWSITLGGSGENYGKGIAVDSSGNILVAGYTTSAGWISGGWNPTYGGNGDLFVVKLSPTGGQIWGTYLGGVNAEFRRGIAVDLSGNVLVTGQTNSPGWVSGGWDTSYNGGGDAFVAKLSPSGQHVWSTYLGGSSDDAAQGVAVDSSGNVLVTGFTGSSGWVSGGWDTSYGGFDDAFVTKLSPSGGHLWSTYLGGSNNDYGNGIAVDASGNVLVSGCSYSPGWVSGGWDTTNGDDADAFVVKLRPSGTQLWSTYLGGSRTDDGYGIAVDASGNVVATGYTESPGWVSGGYQTTNSGCDAYVVKLSPTGAHLWSTYLGGYAEDYAYGVAVDASGDILVTGTTLSSGWVSGGWDTSYNGGYDAFVVKLGSAGGHIWSSYYGGSGDEWGGAIAGDALGNVLVTGMTSPDNRPYSGGWQVGHNRSDTFVAKISSVKVALSAATLPEDQSAGSLAGTFCTSDSAARGDTYSYSLVTGPGDTDNASFAIVGDQLMTAAVLDYETKASYSIRVLSTSSSGILTENVFTISLTDVNLPPTDVTLSAFYIAVGQPSEQLVGTLAGVDPEAPGTQFAYTLVGGAGGEDNGEFAIVGNQLKTAAVLPSRGSPVWHVRVRVTDAGGMWFEKAFELQADTPPTAPAALTATGLNYTQVRLDWSAASDPETGVTNYKVYRDGTFVGTVPAGQLTFTDSSLVFETGYSYAVSAVNGIGIEGAQALVSLTYTDTFPPTVASSVWLWEDHAQVVFGEPVEAATAQNPANYAITCPSQYVKVLS